MNKGILLVCALALFSCFGCTHKESARQQQIQKGNAYYQVGDGTATRRQERDRDSQSLYQDESSQTNYGYQGRAPQFGRNDRIRNSGQNEVGYFHVNPINYDKNNAATTPKIFIDRPILAKHIAQLVTELAPVKTATTLVTDDHVFIGLQYHKSSAGKGKMSKQQAIKEARRVAESVTPRYYKVHVTGRQDLERKINNVGMRMQRNGDVEGIRGDLNKLLKQMGDTTPPG